VGARPASRGRFSRRSRPGMMSFRPPRFQDAGARSLESAPMLQKQINDESSRGNSAKIRRFSPSVEFGSPNGEGRKAGRSKGLAQGEAASLGRTSWSRRPGGGVQGLTSDRCGRRRGRGWGDEPGSWASTGHDEPTSHFQLRTSKGTGLAARAQSTPGERHLLRSLVSADTESMVRVWAPVLASCGSRILGGFCQLKLEGRGRIIYL